MIGELVAFMMGALVTAFLGIPLAVRLAQVQVWRRPALADQREKLAVAARTRFEPVDFGPDLIKWPSEMARPVTNIPDPPWPSAGWDDAHFGKAARTFAAAQPPTQAPAQRSAPKPKPKRAEPKAAPANSQAPRAEPAPAEKPGPAKQQKQSKAPRPVQAEPVEAEVRSDAGRSAEQVDRAKVEAMVAELGLAGTVQHLMKLHDWDFKTAAGWLARARKG